VLTEEKLKAAICEQMKYHRKVKRMTRQVLADISGVHVMTIAKYEGSNYDYTPRLSTLMFIANALDITLSELLEGL